MKKNGFSHIRRWLWLYLLAVLFTTTAAYIIIYNEVSALIEVVPSIAVPDGQGLQAANEIALTGIKIRILLLLTAGLLFVMVLSLLWLRTANRQIHKPIHVIQRALYRLAQGKLNETVTMDTADELGHIAGSVNELAANLQELLLYIWKQTGQCASTLDTIKALADSGNDGQSQAETLKELEKLSEAINSLRQMAKAYVFYDVRLNGEETLAINQPGKKVSAEDAP